MNTARHLDLDRLHAEDAHGFRPGGVGDAAAGGAGVGKMFIFSMTCGVRDHSVEQRYGP